jgi:hypothetical protein
MRRRFIRTKYLLTNSKVQLRYLTLMLVSMIVPMVFVGGCLYYFIFTIMAEQLGVPEYIAYNLFPVIKKVNMMLLVGLPPIFILLLLWGIILSHRLAGPIERIEKDIKDILSKRDYEKRIVLRKHDDLKPLSNTINRLVERLNEK